MRKWSAMLAISLAFLAVAGPISAAWGQEPRTARLAPGAVGMILGRQVIDQQGTIVGRLVDFVVSQSGQPLAGVVDVGGFMGIGMHRVAISWSLLRFRQDVGDVQVVVDMLLDEIAAGPAFRGLDGGVIVVGKAGS